MMNLKINGTMAACLVGLAALVGCGDDDDGAGGGGTGGDASTTATTSSSSNSASSGSGGDDTSSTTTGSGGNGSGAFVFADDDYDAYEQIDRHGAPEAGTAGIEGEQGLGFADEADIDIRDDYNASNPEEDVAGTWVPEIQESVEIFHAVLDDDITGFGLTPATVEESLAQAGPVIVPDTIKYDPSLPTGYPNGRRLEDQVVDITLAVVLLKIDENQPPTILADLPLNPPANDVPFEDEFPFLAPPHEGDAEQ